MASGSEHLSPGLHGYLAGHSTPPDALLRDLVDNVLLHGRVVDPEPDAEAIAVRQFNEHALADGRVVLVMLPIADGLTVARRK